jgi:hypothetical protein
MLFHHQHLKTGSCHIPGNRTPGWPAAYNDQIVVKRHTNISDF